MFFKKIQDSLLREAEKIIDKTLLPLMLNHPSYNDRYRKVFSLPLKDGCLISILLPEDRANEYERSIRICEPLQNDNAIDAEFHQEKSFRKSGKKNRNKLERISCQSKISSMIKSHIL